MKLTLQQLVDSISALARLARRQPLPQMMPAQAVPPPPKLPAKTNYKIGRIWDDARREYTKLEERRQELVKENGGTGVVPGDARLPEPEANDSAEERARKLALIKAVDQEYKGWLEVEIEVWSGFDPLAFEEMQEADLTPEEWGLLRWMVAEPKDMAFTPPAPAEPSAPAAAGAPTA